MAESTLSLSFTDIHLEVASFLGSSDNVDRYINAGLRQFYYPPAIDGLEPGYEWSFLKPTATISTAASDAAQDLPDGFSRLLGDFHFIPTVHHRPIIQVSEHRLQLMLQTDLSESRPRICAIRHKNSNLSSGQRQEVAWWPIPDAAYVLTYRYEAFSEKLVDGSEVYPLGGMKHSETIVESCLAIAEQRANDERGIHWEAFVRAIINSAEIDRRGGARYFGPMGGGGEDVLPRHGSASSYDVTYKAVTW